MPAQWSKHCSCSEVTLVYKPRYTMSTSHKAAQEERLGCRPIPAHGLHSCQEVNVLRLLRNVQLPMRMGSNINTRPS